MRIERGILANSGWLILVFVLLSLTLIVWLPAWHGSTFTEQNEGRRTMMQLCAGGLAVLGFYLHFVRIRHAARGEANTRYLKLIEMLGSMRQGDGPAQVPNIETRLCSIYGLGKLGEDSETDYPTITKALARYVRVNARDEPVSPAGELVTTRKDSGLRADLQTAMEVISRASPHKGTLRPVIDIRGAYLRDLELHNANLDGADLREAALYAAVLDDVSLKGATFERAVLDNASLETATFSQSTSFARADVASALFYRAGGRAERDRGLSPAQIARSINWESAGFSDDFLEAVRQVTISEDF